VDAVLCSVQPGTQESQASRSHSLRVRLGVRATMAIAFDQRTGSGTAVMYCAGPSPSSLSPIP
jgi:hypothetical protein